MDYPYTSIVAGAIATYVLATLVAALIASFGFPLPKGTRIGCIDGLRGYLALSVLIHHFIIWLQVLRLGRGWVPPSVNLFNQVGASAVALFFMTTGFVFYPRVLAGFRSVSWPAVVTSRVFRIVPLIIVSVAVITTIIALRTGRDVDRGFAKSALLWIACWGQPPLLRYPDSGRLDAYVLWSLWYEWLFYLFVLPACALARDVIRGPSWPIPVALLAITFVGRAVDLPIDMLKFLPLFAIGMLAYECSQCDRLADILRQPLSGAAAVAALGIAMVTFATPYDYALPFFAAFFCCVACGHSFGGLLRTKAALVLGECSYGIYLIHGTVLSLLFIDGSEIVQRFTTTQLPVLMPCAALVVGILTPILYLLVERPAIRIGARVARLWTGRQLRVATLELDVAP